MSDKLQRRRQAPVFNRFQPQHDNAQPVERELDPQKDGALQFLPAYDRSSKALVGASWDAILDEDEKKTDLSPSPAASTLHGSSVAARARDFKRNRLQQQNQRRTAEPPIQLAQSEVSSPRGRIGRLAMLFSSRASVQSDTPQGTSPQRPSSPESGSSSGYAGWPGTQDKRGATIRNPSLDESSSATGPSEEDAQRLAPSSCVQWKSPTNDENQCNQKRLPSFSAMRYAKSDIGLQDSRGQWRIAPSAHQARGTSKPLAPRSDVCSSSESASLTSSAYMNENEMANLSSNVPTEQDRNHQKMTNHDRNHQKMTNSSNVKSSITFPTFRGSTTVLRNNGLEPQPPTEERLQVNDRLMPPHRTFHAATGYRGLIEKTKEVPSLMDTMDSDSMSSSKANSNYSVTGITVRNTTNAIARGSDSESDVFDGISVRAESEIFDNITEVSDGRKSPFSRKVMYGAYPERIAEEDEDGGNDEPFSLVLLGGGLTAIQSTAAGFSNRETASDYDDNLTNSEVDQHGFAHVPSFHQMLSAGRREKDSSLAGIQGNIGLAHPSRVPPPSQHVDDHRASSDDGSSLFTDPYEHEAVFLSDLSEYYIHPRSMKKLIRRYRRLSDNRNVRAMTLEEFEREEDENKAFALFEMRSRIMEKDIERGLERRGGTVVVDDLVTTPFYRTGLRIRDACIVSKAWRDGASPQDVINSALLTRRADHIYYIKRAVASKEKKSGLGGKTSGLRKYTWEAVRWMDDTDFMLYRCPSLGPRHMRGFEMFTVGDCQSILLKLTNEQCLVRNLC